MIGLILTEDIANNFLHCYASQQLQTRDVNPKSRS